MTYRQRWISQQHNGWDIQLPYKAERNSLLHVAEILMLESEIRSSKR